MQSIGPLMLALKKMGGRIVMVTLVEKKQWQFVLLVPVLTVPVLTGAGNSIR